MRSRFERHDSAALKVYAAGFIGLLVFSRGCAEYVEVSNSEIIEFIENSGYNNPVITDIDKSPNPAIAFGCSEGHAIKYEFDAVSTNTGRDFSGIVCDGLMQGKSLRD